MSSSQWLVSISHDISILDSFRSLVFKIFNKHNFRYPNEETKFVVKTYETLRYNSFKHRPLTLSILRNGSFELSCLSIRAIVSKEINLFRWQKRLKRTKRRSRADQTITHKRTISITSRSERIKQLQKIFKLCVSFEEASSKKLAMN